MYHNRISLNTTLYLFYISRGKHILNVEMDSLLRHRLDPLEDHNYMDTHTHKYNYTHTQTVPLQ